MSLNPRLSISSRYSVKNINPQYYGSIDVATSGDSSSVQIGTKISGDTGYVFAPYIMAPIIYDGWSFETTEEKAERIREERKKKMYRIFKDNI